MTIRKTPRIYDAARPLYEEAINNENFFRQKTIEINCQIEYIKQSIIHTKDSQALADNVLSVENTCTELLKVVERYPKLDFTDLNRLLTTCMFVREMILMPSTFTSNTKRTQKLREDMADGTESKSIEMVEMLLNDALPIISDIPHGSDGIERIRGAIHENTAAALLNHRQNGQFIALPTSLENDVINGIDLEAYYAAQNGKCYMTPISIKSSRYEADKDRQRNPHLVVIAAADFNNTNLSISRLLIKKNAGFPGLNDSEESMLQDAQQSIYQTFCDQVSEHCSTLELPRYPARETIAKLGGIAI